MLINPDPVVCTCGYDTAKGKHADDCPMGQFYRLAEMQTARRCADIATEKHEATGRQAAEDIAILIRHEFNLENEGN